MEISTVKQARKFSAFFLILKPSSGLLMVLLFTACTRHAVKNGPWPNGAKCHLHRECTVHSAQCTVHSTHILKPSKARTRRTEFVGLCGLFVKNLLIRHNYEFFFTINMKYFNTYRVYTIHGLLSWALAV